MYLEKRLIVLGNLLFGISIASAIILPIYGMSIMSNYYTKELGIVYIIVGIVTIIPGFITKSVMDALADIHANTRRALEMTSSSSSTFSNMKISSNTDFQNTNGWRCSNCNKLNKFHVSTCSCGQSRVKNKK